MQGRRRIKERQTKAEIRQEDIKGRKREYTWKKICLTSFRAPVEVPSVVMNRVTTVNLLLVLT